MSNEIDLATFMKRFDMMKTDIEALCEYPSVEGIDSYTARYEDAHGRDIIVEARPSDGLLHVHIVKDGGELEHRGGFSPSGVMSFYPTKEYKARMDELEEYLEEDDF